jgi:molybdopterin-guanine dinucleotide biosynthesis protein A
MTLPPYDAIVLAGGSSRRMGGGDKTALPVAGRPMLDHVVGALAGARTVVVAGPPRPTTRPVRWCREEPPGGGPAAAIAAALPVVSAEVTVVVAGDQPLLSLVAVEQLVGALAGDGAVATDADSRPQWLLGAWRTSALRRAPLAAGASLRDTLGRLAWHAVALPAGCAADCDSPDDVRRIETVLLGRSRTS